eukprot:Mrub_09693.p1 GENE.Mrub_09693~~Mrub_09693.p1  ORF type:complete len:165 (+),score=35.00 Mrub_09693:234-728(+)
MSQFNNTKGSKFNMSMTSMNMSKSKLYNDSTKEKYVYVDNQEVVAAHADVFKNDLDFQLDHFETIRLSYITFSRKVKDTYETIEENLVTKISKLDDMLKEFDDEQAQFVTYAKDELSLINQDDAILNRDLDWAMQRTIENMQFIGADFKEDILLMKGNRGSYTN